MKSSGMVRVTDGVMNGLWVIEPVPITSEIAHATLVVSCGVVVLVVGVINTVVMLYVMVVRSVILVRGDRDDSPIGIVGMSVMMKRQVDVRQYLDAKEP